jgi:PAS domain-containing protein
LLANLLLLAANLVTGRFGLYLSLAPGYATPLFLPAGIALAALPRRARTTWWPPISSRKTALKEGTAQLREREARLQAILDKAADAILTIGRDGSVLSANAAAGDAPDTFLRRVAEGDSHEHEATGRRSNGEPFPLALSVSEVELPDGRLFPQRHQRGRGHVPGRR